MFLTFTHKLPGVVSLNRLLRRYHFLFHRRVESLQTARTLPLLAGQSVGGALTSAKSAMSSWFTTLAQPSAGVTPPGGTGPAAETKP